MNLTLLRDCLNIQGEHYTVSNGFVKKVYGDVQLQYKDMLAVELVRQRSKKMMYTMLLPAGILVFAFDLESFVSMIIVAVLAIIICVMGLMHLFSVRQYVEFTSMKGTYRIAIERNDFEIESIITQLQKRIISAK